MAMVRFHALLVEGETASLGFEQTLREEGCAVRRASTRAHALEGIAEVDIVIVSSPAMSDDDVMEIVTKAERAAVLVVSQSSELAVRAARVGAAVSVGQAPELVSAQIRQLLSVVELRQRVARNSTVVPAGTVPSSSVLARRLAPLPKEATPDALCALIEAAEGLVPMDKFQRAYVDYALRRFGGNKVHTAAALGIDRRTIQRWARARLEQRTTTLANTTGPQALVSAAPIPPNVASNVAPVSVP